MVRMVKQLVKSLLSVNLWYWSTGCYVSQVSLNTCKYSWKIQRYRISELMTRWDRYLSSLIKTNVFLNYISSLHVILFYNFVYHYLMETINWLSIYLFSNAKKKKNKMAIQVNQKTMQSLLVFKFEITASLVFLTSFVFSWPIW